jgi:hypothetical protein
MASLVLLLTFIFVCCFRAYDFWLKQSLPIIFLWCDVIYESLCHLYPLREITMAGLRRLLEDDLKLDKFSLDPYKKFISKQLDEVHILV